MEFTPDLTAFQGLIISIDKTYSFSKITAKVGNRQKIEAITKSLQNYLHIVKYLKDGKVAENKTDEVRKLSIFLILNADLRVLQDMVGIDAIHSVIWTIPTIPKCILNEMLWVFTDFIVYETIAFSRPQLALEVIDVLLEYLKESPFSTYLNKLRVISSACYRLISRLHFYNFDMGMLTNTLTHAYNNFLVCMKLYVAPANLKEHRNLSKDEEYKYKGNCLHTVFNLIDNCLDQYVNNQLFTAADFNELYLLTFILDELTVEIHNKQDRSKETWDCLDNCNSSLLDMCKELVMDVSVDIFCAWSEFEVDGKSIQQTIGESAYCLRTKLLKIKNVVEHPVVSMMEQISCKPECIEEIINTIDSQTIISNIVTNNNKEEWIHALLQRENLCQDIGIIETLLMNLDVLNKEECRTLFHMCLLHLRNNSENANVNKLAAKSFQYCDENIKLDLLENYFKDDCFFNMNETEDFHYMMTKIFNKLISTSMSKVYEVLDVFIQNPFKVYLKLFILATENHQQTEIMLKAMNLLKKFSNHYYTHETEPSLIIVIKTILNNHLQTAIQQQNFVKFVSSLKNDDYISGVKMLLLVVMPNIHKALLSNDVNSLNILCQLLLECYTLGDLLEYRAPMLAMLAQVMEVVRWKIDSFISIAPDTLSCVIRLQTLMFSSYGENIPENDATWLKLKLANISSLNRYYFRKLWDESNKSFIETTSGLIITKSTSEAQLSAYLTLIFCSCTQCELCEVWENLSIFESETKLEIFHKALTVIQETESQNRTEKTYDCLVNCFKNLVFIMRYKYFREPVTCEQVQNVVKKLLLLTNKIGEENVEEIANILIPLIVFITEKKTDHNVKVLNLFSNSLISSKIVNVLSKVNS